MINSINFSELINDRYCYNYVYPELADYLKFRYSNFSYHSTYVEYIAKRLLFAESKKITSNTPTTVLFAFNCIIFSESPDFVKDLEIDNIIKDVSEASEGDRIMYDELAYPASLIGVKNKLNELYKLDTEDERVMILNKFLERSYVADRVLCYKTNDDKNVYCLPFRTSGYEPENRSFFKTTLIMLISMIFLLQEKYANAAEHSDAVDELSVMLTSYSIDNDRDSLNEAMLKLDCMDEIINERLIKIHEIIKNKESNRLYERKHSVNHKIIEYTNAIQRCKSELIGIERNIDILMQASSDNERMGDFVKFIRSCPMVTIQDINNDGIVRINVNSYIKVWQDSHLETIMGNNYRSEFVSKWSELYDRNDAIKLFKLLFEDCEAKIAVNQSFSINFANMSISASETSKKIHRNGVSVPNVHITRYNCWSASHAVAAQFMNKGEYQAVIMQLINATESFNLMDGTVMNAFAEYTMDERCIEYKDNMYTAIELIELLKGEEDND